MALRRGLGNFTTSPSNRRSRLGGSVVEAAGPPRRSERWPKSSREGLETGSRAADPRCGPPPSAPYDLATMLPPEGVPRRTPQGLPMREQVLLAQRVALARAPSDHRDGAVAGRRGVGGAWTGSRSGVKPNRDERTTPRPSPIPRFPLCYPVPKPFACSSRPQPDEAVDVIEPDQSQPRSVAISTACARSVTSSFW